MRLVRTTVAGAAGRRRPFLLASIDAMQETAETSPLQLLFIELRVGLARSAIQAALLLNGGASVVPSPALGESVASSTWRQLGAAKNGHVAILAWACSIAGMTFVNAYVAQGAIASAAQAHSATPCDD